MGNNSSKNRISLCVIAGNVERYITRFIDAFSPLVDEIVVVRAMGTQEPDKTLQIAQERGCRTNVYINGEDFPHIDDFAQARNLAFSMAANDWIMWADTDDVIDADSIQAIMEAVDAHGDKADCFSFDYHVPEDGLCVIKDRIIRKGTAKWRYRVHEELAPTIDKPRYVVINDARITHMPSGKRTTNDARNLRLLEAMDADGTMTIGHKFHLLNTVRAMGQSDRALQLSAELLASKDLGGPERYDIIMSMGQMCPDMDRQAQLYMQALLADPSRREAYGELAINACRTGRWPQMLAWTTAMQAIPRPSAYLWSHRDQYYGWGGIRLHATALRLNGRRRTGDILQENHFKKHGAKISLLHATRGRSKKALAAQNLWMNRALDGDAVEHIFAIDADDEQALPLSANLSVVVAPGGGCVAAWNAAAATCHGQVLVQMSDDFEPPMHWDKIILERLGDLRLPKVLAVSDGGRNDGLLCMAILTRARYKAQGYLFHPEFRSMYSDNYFTHCAYRDKCVIEARDVIFEHMHPAFGKAEMDETYAQSNAPERYNEGLEIFNSLIDKDVSE